MSPRAAGLVFALCLACHAEQRAPATAPALDVHVRATPSVAADEPELPRRASAPCVVRGDGPAGHDVMLFGDRALSRELLQVGSSSGVQFALTELARGDGVARARIGGQGLVRVDGFSRVAPDQLRLRQEVRSLGGHARLLAATSLHAVYAETGAALQIGIGTHLLSPAEIREHVPCNALRWGDVFVKNPVRVDPDRPDIAEWDEHRVSGSRLSLHAAPGGARVVELVFRKPGERGAHPLERRGDWLRVRVPSNVQFEGWVHVSELVMPAAHLGAMTGGGGSHRAPRLRAHPKLVPISSIERETDLYVADADGTPERIGTAERGVDVRLGRRRGELVELAFDSGYVTPPVGKSFLVAADAVSAPRQEDRNIAWKPGPLPELDEAVAP